MAEERSLRSPVLAAVCTIAMIVGLAVIWFSLNAWLGGVFLGLLITAIGAVALLRLMRGKRRAQAR